MVTVPARGRGAGPGLRLPGPFQLELKLPQVPSLPCPAAVIMASESSGEICPGTSQFNGPGGTSHLISKRSPGGTDVPLAPRPMLLGRCSAGTMLGPSCSVIIDPASDSDNYIENYRKLFIDVPQ